MADNSIQKTSRKEVWAVLERERGELSRISLELLSGGKKLAEKLSADFAAILWGDNLESLPDVTVRFGVNKVYQQKTLPEDSLSFEKIAFFLGKQIRYFSPHLVLFGATQKGEELSLRTSAAIAVPLLPHCESLEVEGGDRVVVTRPVFNGNFSMESVRLGEQTTLVSVLPRKWNPEPAKPYSQSFDLVEFPEISEELPSCPFQMLETIKINPQDVDLSNAEVVVGGGRGVGNKENFTNIEELAALLNGVVGGSRVAVCNGWIPFDRQIGQSGKTISPHLYVACGISGAIHHQMGIKDSELIMAINTDRNAPIFKLANVGVVADLNTILPDLITRLKFLKEEKAKTNA